MVEFPRTDIVPVLGLFHLDSMLLDECGGWSRVEKLVTSGYDRCYI